MDTDIVVIGAGVVGLAIGRGLALSGKSVVILEQEVGFGRHSSSRNSEVVHAGFYYEPGSLKAQTCVAGYRLLMDYAQAKNITLKLIGKIVVASNSNELEKLEFLRQQGITNGVAKLELVNAAELEKLEPHVYGCGALFSPGTGIIDSHAFMQSLLTDFETAGGTIAYSSEVLKGTTSNDGVCLEVGGVEPTTIDSQIVINSAGLFAPTMAQKLGSSTEVAVIGRLVKGHYLKYQAPSPFTHLVYPLPTADGLGIHATLNLAGQVRFGPDTMDVNEINYGVADSLRQRFAKSIARYWPAVDQQLLTPDYAGIRSKIVMPRNRAHDFVIDDRRKHGVGVVNLFGIESPGLTSSLALADRILTLL